MTDPAGPPADRMANPCMPARVGEPPAVVQVVLFDCDGTLANSAAGLFQAAADALASEGLPAPNPRHLMRLIGLSVADALTAALPDASDAQRRRLALAFEEALARIQARGVEEPLYPGLKHLVASLSAEGRLLGVVTGKSTRGLKQTLSQNGISEAFSVLRTPDHGPPKPNPWPLLDAVAAVGGAPDAAVMIGDTSFDMQAAVAAGVTPLGVSWGYHPPAALREAGAVAVAEDAAHLHRLITMALGAPPNAITAP